ncbi:MAG: hypothetical protein AAFX80_11425 [Cyanobacteria bacterium J06639_18]
MSRKFNKLKLITLSSLIFLVTIGYNNNHKATAQQNNTTRVERVGNKQSNNELAKAEIEGYKGVVKSCSRDDEFVTCDVLITSTKKDKELKLFVWPRFGNLPDTRIIDLDGNEYIANSIKYGVRESSNSLRVDLVQGVPQKIVVNFTKVPVEVNKIAVMELNGLLVKFQFRDFAISNNK